jgi:serine/threonine protein kinase
VNRQLAFKGQATGGGAVTDDFRSASGQFAPGTEVAGYLIGEQIGRGGMAVVYRAHDVRLDRWVALKILAPEIASDESFRQRFISESRAAAAVDHPHVIPVFEAGEADGVLFIAMRYVVGGDVRKLLGQTGPMDAARVCSIVGQVASALDAAHASGLVHRDVKPANMLLGVVAGSGHPDHVYLSDFGLSKQALSTAGLTMAGQFLGTLDYIAPEQIEGRGVDGRADLYALASAAFEMLSGAPPFERERKEALVWAQLSEPPPPLTSRRRDLPPAVDQVMAKALAKSPDDRFATCLDFAVSLRAACGLESDPGGQFPPGPPRAATELAGPVRTASPPTAQDRLTDHRWPADAAATRASQGPGAPRSAQQGWPPAPPAFPSSPAPPGRPRRRSRAGAAVAAVAVLVILGLAAGAFVLLRGRGPHPAPVAGNSQSATAGPGSSASQGKPASHGSSASPGSSASQAGSGNSGSPASTVTAYVAAINSKDYLRAWNLGGRNTGTSYQGFVQGFSTTAKDTATILSVTGNVVTARINALQTDGTVKTYQGTYTVQNGVITQFNVSQTG